jgi:hypothetical protein
MAVSLPKPYGGFRSTTAAHRDNFRNGVKAGGGGKGLYEGSFAVKLLTKNSTITDTRFSQK